MKPIDEALKPQTLEDLRGFYRASDDYSCCVCVLPSAEKTLTPDNFRLITAIGVLTVDDFWWYDKNISNRDFAFGDGLNYLDRFKIPSEVSFLLTTVISIKFAACHLADAKARLEAIDNDELNQSINKAITTFESLDEATEWEKKLQIAYNALEKTAEAFEDVDEDLYDHFCMSANVISEVIDELIDISENS